MRGWNAIDAPTQRKISLIDSQDVNVPGGQDIFVARNGALGFSRAHGNYLPDGATGGPFKATFNSIGRVLGQFTFSGNGSSGWLACPIAEEGPWQVFTAIEGLDDGDVPGGCVSVLNSRRLRLSIIERGRRHFSMSEAVRMAG